jgi:hypothetical protein
MPHQELSPMYDSIVNTLILVVDLAILWLIWQEAAKKEKQRMTRKFNKILQKAGLK